MIRTVGSGSGAAPAGARSAAGAGQDLRFISLVDPSDDRVADDVRGAERLIPIPSTMSSRLTHASIRRYGHRRRKISICFGSPHTTIRLFWPNRVRNIFICSRVVSALRPE